MTSCGIYAKTSFRNSRIKRGYSLRNIAKAAGLTPAVLSRLENGGAILPSTAGKICGVFNCEFDELFKISDDSERGELHAG